MSSQRLDTRWGREQSSPGASSSTSPAAPTDPNSFVAIEAFEDRQAPVRQDAQARSREYARAVDRSREEATRARRAAKRSACSSRAFAHPG